jgi:SAM-dependent methyltransferase
MSIRRRKGDAMSTAPTMAEEGVGAPDPGPIMQLGTAFWASKTLLSAVELGLFTELAANGPDDAEALQERLGLHPRSARDFFDALVALGMLERSDGVYENTTETALFLDRAKPSYVGGMLEMLNARLFGFWNSLTDGLRSGEPQNESRLGEDFFAKLYSEPSRLSGFLKAMTGISAGAAHALAGGFPWADHETVLDVGCAQGCVSAVLAQSHDHLRGGGFDLPAVQPYFEEHMAASGVADRMAFTAGDFFADELPRADVIVMGHILHDWNLEEKMALLRNAYRALPDGGTLIVYEALIDDARRENTFGLLMSLNMLIETPGGFDYTGEDCRSWMRDVGFAQSSVHHLIGPDSMVVARK